MCKIVRWTATAGNSGGTEIRGAEIREGQLYMFTLKGTLLGHDLHTKWPVFAGLKSTLSSENVKKVFPLEVWERHSPRGSSDWTDACGKPLRVAGFVTRKARVLRCALPRHVNCRGNRKAQEFMVCQNARCRATVQSHHGANQNLGPRFQAR
jgi:hypothetical protein